MRRYCRGTINIVLTQEEQLIRDFLVGPRDRANAHPNLEGPDGLYTFGAQLRIHRKRLVPFVAAWLKHGYLKEQREGASVSLTDKGRDFLRRG